MTTEKCIPPIFIKRTIQFIVAPNTHVPIHLQNCIDERNLKTILFLQIFIGHR